MLWVDCLETYSFLCFFFRAQAPLKAPVMILTSSRVLTACFLIVFDYMLCLEEAPCTAKYREAIESLMHSAGGKKVSSLRVDC